MSKINVGWSIIETNDPNPNRSSSIFMIWIRDPKFLFRMSKIADEKLWSVSFHNHLVARYHIYNSWSSTSVNISSARLGKMGKFLMWLRTSQPSSKSRHALGSPTRGNEPPVAASGKLVEPRTTCDVNEAHERAEYRHAPRPRPRAENKRHRFTTADVIAWHHFADARKFDASCERRAAQTTRSWKAEARLEREHRAGRAKLQRQVDEHTTLAARECATRPTR